MKKLLTLLFLVAVFCPVAFAQYQNKASKEVRKGVQEVISAEVKTKPQGTKPNPNAKVTTNDDQSKWYKKQVVNREYVTEEQGYFNGVDYEEGRKMTSDSYEVITLQVPASAIKDKIVIDQFSDKPAIYFNEEHNAIVVVNPEDEGDKVFIKLDYNFSLRPSDAAQWQASDPDARSIDGKTLTLTFRYAPKYFTVTTEESEAKGLTYPIISYNDKNIYLVSTVDLRKDFATK